MARAPTALALPLLLLLGCGDPPPREVTLATWNVHRLFDARCDSGRCGPGDFEAAPSAPSLEGQLDRIAHALSGLDADVILLQEVETRALVDALIARLGGSHPHAAVGQGGGEGSLRVAVISRFPLQRVARHGEGPLFRPDGSPTTFTREVLEVQVSVDGHAVIVLAAHLKSKRDDDPGRRWAEADALGALGRAAARAHPEALVVVGGDLNDVPGSPPLAALEGEGELCRVAAPLGSRAATHRFEGVDEAIDHLYSVRAVPSAPCAGLARVVGRPETGYAGSDHAALVAAFTLPAVQGRDDPAPDPG